MREILHIHIGEAGIRIGLSLWKLYCGEHNVDLKGCLLPEQRRRPNSTFAEEDLTQNPASYIFSENSHGDKLVPRAIFIDTDIDMEGELKNRALSGLFSGNNVVLGKEGAANNYHRGAFTVGKEYIDVSLCKIRKQLEQSQKPEAAVIFHSINGGTGSGFATSLIERIKVEFKGLKIITVTVAPSVHLSTTIVEPYNAMLSLDRLIDHSDVTLLFTNEQLYQVYEDSLAGSHLESTVKKSESSFPVVDHSVANSMISAVASSLTSASRFHGPKSTEFCSSIVTNLVPYPRNHFLEVSFSQVGHPRHWQKEGSEAAEGFEQLIDRVYSPSSSFFFDRFGHDRGKSRVLASTSIFRSGVDISGIDVSCILNQRIRERADSPVSFLNWSKTGITTSVSHQIPYFSEFSSWTLLGTEPPLSSRRDVCMVCNSPDIRQYLSQLNNKFDMLYAKRAFVHWYVGEGYEGEFTLARENIASLIRDYEQLSDY